MVRRISRRAALLLIASTLAVIPASAGSFWIGFDAGYTLTFPCMDPGYRQNASYGPWSGFSLSVPVQYRTDGILGFETGLKIAEKSFRYLHEYSSFKVDSREHNAYLELPMMVLLSYSDGRFIFSAGAGAYAAFAIARRESGIQTTTSYDTSLSPITKRYGSFSAFGPKDRRFDIGLMAKLSFAFEAAERLWVNVQAIGEFGLLPLEKEYQEGQTMRYNEMLAFSAGILYRFGGDE